MLQKLRSKYKVLNELSRAVLGSFCFLSHYHAFLLRAAVCRLAIFSLSAE